MVEEPAEDAEDAEGLLVFTEPNLALSLAERRGGSLVLRICQPSW